MKSKPIRKKTFLSVHQRLYDNCTISSFKKCNFTKSERCDRLDLSLSSTYNHCKELFPDKQDYYIQRETKSVGVWGLHGFVFEQLKSGHMGHLIKFGGIPDRISPYSVKLMNSSHHSSATAPGFSRKAKGGMIYFY